MIGWFADTVIVGVIITHQNLTAGNCFEPPTGFTVFYMNGFIHRLVLTQRQKTVGREVDI